jgi:hypothetical protein
MTNPGDTFDSPEQGIEQLADAPDAAAMERIREAARRDQVRSRGTGRESVE